MLLDADGNPIRVMNDDNWLPPIPGGPTPVADIQPQDQSAAFANLISSELGAGPANAGPTPQVYDYGTPEAPELPEPPPSRLIDQGPPPDNYPEANPFLSSLFSGLGQAGNFVNETLGGLPAEADTALLGHHATLSEEQQWLRRFNAEPAAFTGEEFGRIAGQEARGLANLTSPKNTTIDLGNDVANNIINAANPLDAPITAIHDAATMLQGPASLFETDEDPNNPLNRAVKAIQTGLSTTISNDPNAGAQNEQAAKDLVRAIGDITNKIIDPNLIEQAVKDNMVSTGADDATAGYWGHTLAQPLSFIAGFVGPTQKLYMAQFIGSLISDPQGFIASTQQSLGDTWSLINKTNQWIQGQGPAPSSDDISKGMTALEQQGALLASAIGHGRGMISRAAQDRATPRPVREVTNNPEEATQGQPVQTFARDLRRAPTLRPAMAAYGEAKDPNAIAQDVQDRVANDPVAGSVSDALQSAGGEVHAVGGVVRDAVSGIDHNDIDLRAHGLPIDNVRQVLQDWVAQDSDHRYIAETGNNFGIFRAGVKDDNGAVVSESEIALPRVERSTGRGYNDFEVQSNPFLSGDEDAARRDFTKNSAYVNLRTGLLHDPHNAIGDIAHNHLRTVSPTSIEEDPVRALRAFVDISKRDSTPTPELIEQIRKNSRVFSEKDENGNWIVPRERILKELDKVMSGSSPATAIEVMQRAGVLQELVPELERQVGFDQKNPYHNQQLWNHTLGVLQRVSELNEDPDVRWAALFHDIGKPDSQWIDENGNGRYYENPELGKQSHEDLGAQMTKDVLTELGMPKDRISKITSLVQNHMWNKDIRTNHLIGKLADDLGGRPENEIRSLAFQRAHSLADLREADSFNKENPTEGGATRLRNELKTMEAAPPQRIGLPKGLGHDLIQNGIEPKGELFGRFMNVIKDAVHRDVIPNDRAAILDWAKQNYPEFSREHANEEPGERQGVQAYATDEIQQRQPVVTSGYPGELGEANKWVNPVDHLVNKWSMARSEDLPAVAREFQERVQNVLDNTKDPKAISVVRGYLEAAISSSEGRPVEAQATNMLRETLGLLPPEEGFSLHRELNQNGGFTVDENGKPVTSGFSVGVAPEKTAVLPNATPADIARFQRENAGNGIGGWKDDQGVTHLDVINVLPDQEAALRLAEQHNEQSIYDLTTGTEIANPNYDPTRDTRNAIQPQTTGGTSAAATTGGTSRADATTGTTTTSPTGDTTDVGVTAAGTTTAAGGTTTRPTYANAESAATGLGFARSTTRDATGLATGIDRTSGIAGTRPSTGNAPDLGTGNVPSNAPTDAEAAARTAAEAARTTTEPSTTGYTTADATSRHLQAAERGTTIDEQATTTGTTGWRDTTSNTGELLNQLREAAPRYGVDPVLLDHLGLETVRLLPEEHTELNNFTQGKVQDRFHLYIPDDPALRPTDIKAPDWKVLDIANRIREGLAKEGVQTPEVPAYLSDNTHMILATLKGWDKRFFYENANDFPGRLDWSQFSDGAENRFHSSLGAFGDKMSVLQNARAALLHNSRLEVGLYRNGDRIFDPAIRDRLMDNGLLKSEATTRPSGENLVAASEGRALPSRKIGDYEAAIQLQPRAPVDMWESREAFGKDKSGDTDKSYDYVYGRNNWLNRIFQKMDPTIQIYNIQSARWYGYQQMVSEALGEIKNAAENSSDPNIRKLASSIKTDLESRDLAETFREVYNLQPGSRLQIYPADRLLADNRQHFDNLISQNVVTQRYLKGVLGQGDKDLQDFQVENSRLTSYLKANPEFQKALSDFYKTYYEDLKLPGKGPVRSQLTIYQGLGPVAEKIAETAYRLSPEGLSKLENDRNQMLEEIKGLPSAVNLKDQIMALARPAVAAFQGHFEDARTELGKTFGVDLPFHMKIDNSDGIAFYHPDSPNEINFNSKKALAPAVLKTLGKRLSITLQTARGLMNSGAYSRLVNAVQDMSKTTQFSIIQHLAAHEMIHGFQERILGVRLDPHNNAPALANAWIDKFAAHPEYLHGLVEEGLGNELEAVIHQVTGLGLNEALGGVDKARIRSTPMDLGVALERIIEHQNYQYMAYKGIPHANYSFASDEVLSRNVHNPEQAEASRQALGKIFDSDLASREVSDRLAAEADAQRTGRGPNPELAGSLPSPEEPAIASGRSVPAAELALSNHANAADPAAAFGRNTTAAYQNGGINGWLEAYGKEKPSHSALESVRRATIDAWRSVKKEPSDTPQAYAAKLATAAGRDVFRDQEIYRGIHGQGALFHDIGQDGPIRGVKVDQTHQYTLTGQGLDYSDTNTPEGGPSQRKIVDDLTRNSFTPDARIQALKDAGYSWVRSYNPSLDGLTDGVAVIDKDHLHIGSPQDIVNSWGHHYQRGIQAAVGFARDLENANRESTPTLFEGVDKDRLIDQMNQNATASAEDVHPTPLTPERRATLKANASEFSPVGEPNRATAVEIPADATIESIEKQVASEVDKPAVSPADMPVVQRAMDNKTDGHIELMKEIEESPNEATMAGLREASIEAAGGTQGFAKPPVTPAGPPTPPTPPTRTGAGGGAGRGRNQRSKVPLDGEHIAHLSELASQGGAMGKFGQALANVHFKFQDRLQPARIISNPVEWFKQHIYASMAAQYHVDNAVGAFKEAIPDIKDRTSIIRTFDGTKNEEERQSRVNQLPQELRPAADALYSYWQLTGRTAKSAGAIDTALDYYLPHIILQDGKSKPIAANSRLVSTFTPNQIERLRDQNGDVLHPNLQSLNRVGHRTLDDPADILMAHGTSMGRAIRSHEMVDYLKTLTFDDHKQFSGPALVTDAEYASLPRQLKSQMDIVRTGDLKGTLDGYKVWTPLRDQMERLSNSWEEPGVGNSLGKYVNWANSFVKQYKFAVSPIHVMNVNSNFSSLLSETEHPLVRVVNMINPLSPITKMGVGFNLKDLSWDLHDLHNKLPAWGWKLPDRQVDISRLGGLLGKSINAKGTDIINNDPERHGQFIEWGARPPILENMPEDLTQVMRNTADRLPITSFFHKLYWNTNIYHNYIGAMDTLYNHRVADQARVLGRALNPDELDAVGRQTADDMNRAAGFFNKLDMTKNYRMYAGIGMFSRDFTTAQIRMLGDALGIKRFGNFGGGETTLRDLGTTSNKIGTLQPNVSPDFQNRLARYRTTASRNVIFGGTFRLLMGAFIAQGLYSQLTSGQFMTPVQAFQKDPMHTFDIYTGRSADGHDMWIRNPLFGMQHELMDYVGSAFAAQRAAKGPMDIAKAPLERATGKINPILSNGLSALTGVEISRWLSGHPIYTKQGDTYSIDADKTITNLRKSLDMMGVPDLGSVEDQLIYFLRSTGSVGLPTNLPQPTTDLGKLADAMGYSAWDIGSFNPLRSLESAVGIQARQGNQFYTLPNGQQMESSQYWAMNDQYKADMADIQKAVNSGDLNAINRIASKYGWSTDKTAQKIAESAVYSNVGRAPQAPGSINPNADISRALGIGPSAKQDSIFGHHLDAVQSAQFEADKLTARVTAINYVKNTGAFQVANTTDRFAMIDAAQKLSDKANEYRAAQELGIKPGHMTTDDVDYVVRSTFNAQNDVLSNLKNDSAYQSLNPDQQSAVRQTAITNANSMIWDWVVNGKFKGMHYNTLIEFQGDSLKFQIQTRQLVQGLPTYQQATQNGDLQTADALMNQSVRYAHNLAINSFEGKKGSIPIREIGDTLYRTFYMEEAAREMLQATPMYMQADVPTQDKYMTRYTDLARKLALLDAGLPLDKSDPANLFKEGYNNVLRTRLAADMGYDTLQRRYADPTQITQWEEELAAIKKTYHEQNAVPPSKVSAIDKSIDNWYYQQHPELAAWKKALSTWQSKNGLGQTYKALSQSQYTFAAHSPYSAYAPDPMMLIDPSHI